MTLIDNIVIVLIGSLVTAGATSWWLYRRMQTPTRSWLRVHMSGGTEKGFDASEVGEELVWIQEGERFQARVPLDILPGHMSRWGVHYRVFDIAHGSDEVLRVPWMDANIRAEYLQGDDSAKERFRRRIRALDAFKQLTSGLSSINRWQAVALIILGLFAGLYLSPIIQGAIS